MSDAIADIDPVYRRVNRFMDWDSPNVVAFAQKAGGEGTDREVAVGL